ncbi:D-alanyl-D-alanine carboxypeptidase [Cryobacterium melibiosiphilum]|uniref:D-alanyl-D-alanine carboxypeptidase n=1 Tax=Cryobacterium melibiosiphilum TaxID=995039 RepID=A0A3A5MDE9_9MICO|nr:D-alanyl-D-alanine carboxypeptidase [Cryobacterium melibiosiphilum]RJT87185.1 D-alanyl-D-alanine carboxypeptidase [Cryobacterium melibiosiphilum]
MPYYTRRETYRRRRIAVVSLVTVALVGIIYVGGTGLAPVPVAAATLTQPADATQPAVQPALPSFGSSAVGAVGFPGVLAASGSTGTVPIASITKMVTSLVILDAKPLSGDAPGPEITFTEVDIDFYYEALAEGGSVAPVVGGMQLSQREAMLAMLLASGNNYAESLIVWAYGSEQAYLSAAADWLAEHGLTGTVVADASGISSNSVSTTADLIELAKLVTANPALASMVAIPTIDLPVIGTVENTNTLLGPLPGVSDVTVTGMKTGTTDVAGSCLLFSADITVGSETVTVVGVVLNGESGLEVRQAVAALIESMAPGFQQVTLAEAGESFGQYSTAWGQSARVVAAEAASALVWSDTAITGTAAAESMQLGAVGDDIGSLDFLVGDQTVTVPLELETDLTDPGLGWRMGHPGELIDG